MEMNKRPLGLTQWAAFRMPAHMSPVWCNTPHEYTISTDGRCWSVFGSRIEPWNTSQFSGFPARSFICRQHCTEKGSESKLTTRSAPSACAAYENKPLPQPISMNVRPLSSRRPKNLLVSRIATSIRSESRRFFRNSFQFLPNENCLSDTLQPLPAANAQREREDVVAMFSGSFLRDGHELGPGVGARASRGEGARLCSGSTGRFHRIDSRAANVRSILVRDCSYGNGCSAFPARKASQALSSSACPLEEYERFCRLRFA